MPCGKIIMKKTIDTNLRTQIRRIKINTRRIMQNVLSGDYISAFKGSGLEFDQIREYNMGDDIRFIDWNSSAKMNKIMVKQFIEERDRTIIIAIDISGSTNYSSTPDLRRNYIAQLAGTLAFIAQESKDKVGVLFFSDRIEKWIPPSKGNVHIGSIIEHIFSLQPTSLKTDLSEPLKFLINLKKRNAVVFMISDWIALNTDYTKLLSMANVEYDFIAVRMLDEREHSFPDVGFIEIQDPESGETVTLDTRKHHKTTKNVNLFLGAHAAAGKQLFEKHTIDFLDLTIGRPFVKNLATFFHKRIRRQI